MGSSNSTEKLEIPLHAQSPAVLATANGVAAPQFTSLFVTKPSGWGSNLQVIDARTKQTVYEFKSKLLSSYCTLQTPDGHALACIEAKTFFNRFSLYEGGEHDAKRLEIRVEEFEVPLIFVDFSDRVSGRQCRVLLDGDSSDRVALFYLEYGQPDLLPNPRRRDLANGSRFQAVGRIRRPYGGDFVEAAPGVDLTLLLLLWHVCKQRQVE